MSLTVRHTVIGSHNTNQLEAAYAKTCRALRQNTQPSAIRAAITTHLKPLATDDATLVDDFKRFRTVKNITASDRAILVSMNQAMGTGEMEVSSSGKVQVEHIFPRSPSTEALKESGLTADDADDLTLQLGNLTLLKTKLNQSSSNKPYSSKLPLLSKSELPMTRELVSKYKIWTAQTIQQRTESLGQLATKVWPYSALED